MQANDVFSAMAAGLFAWSAAGATLEDLSPHFSTNTPILWRAPTNHLPKRFQAGKDGKIRQFCLLWPKLEREESYATASASEIIWCIRGRKTPVWPGDGEQDYFGRIKRLAQARRLTVTRVEAYYADGLYGEEPPTNEPAKHVAPAALLDAVADFATNSVSVRLCSPILSSEICRILGNRGEQGRVK